MNFRHTLVFSLLLSTFIHSAEAKTLTLGVIADVNGTGCQTQYPSNSLKAFDQLLTRNSLDHIIMTGDAAHGECIKYTGSVPYQDVVRKMWEEFDKKFFQPARSLEGVNIILAPGNHDAPFLTASSRDTFRAENAEFVRYWQGNKSHLDVEIVQVPGAKDNFPYYWAYTYQDVLFVVLQSTSVHSLSNGVEQKRWLREVLRSPAARAARARIAFGHVPPYAVLDPSVGFKYSEIIEKEQVGQANGLVDLLLDNGVDLLLVGHSHAPYPAKLTRASDKKSMKILSMPCGHAPRKLLGKTELAPRGYAVVEIDDAGVISLGVHNWSDGKLIPASYFPASIPQKDTKVSYQRMENLQR